MQSTVWEGTIIVWKHPTEEADVHSRFEEVRSYLYAKGKDVEYSETQELLSKAAHSFTHETQVIIKRSEGRSGGMCRQLFAIIYRRRGHAFFVHTHCCCCVKIRGMYIGEQIGRRAAEFN